MHAAKVDTHQNQRWTSLIVLTVVLESGERLPCLVDKVTWIPVRVAMRWAVRYRRYRVQSSTLESNLRTIGRIYEWAESVAGLDLDDYLTSGRNLSSRQIESIALRFRNTGDSTEAIVDGIREGKLAGPKARMYFGLPHAERNRYLDGEVQAVHLTALGVCLHDFAVAPCPYHLNCVRGCADYLRIKGSERERRHLIEIRQATEQALASAKAFATRPDGEMAEPWIRHCEETLEGVQAALAVDGEMDAAETGVSQPFPARPSKFQKVSS
jgi:hypothetical protein